MDDPKLITTLPDGKICDFIDGTIRNDTPEEYVRQNILRRLVKELVPTTRKKLDNGTLFDIALINGPPDRPDKLVSRAKRTPPIDHSQP